MAAGSSPASRVPTLQPTMRTLGFRTHALLTVAAAVGVIAALGRAWYAAPPQPIAADAAAGSLHGPADGLMAGIRRWLTETEGTTGWDALGIWGSVVVALAAATALGALGCLVPAIQGVAREALRYGALACVAVVVWKVVDTPGANDALELRFGAFVAAAAALLALSSGSAVAAAPLQRRRVARAAYVAPQAPPRYGPPPGS
jgi:hypothetical protein